MELDPVDGAADTERLVGRHSAGCEMDCTLRQGEGIGVPMEEWRAAAERRDEWIGATGLGWANVFPAELDQPSEDVLGAVSARNQLRSEANAEHRLVRFAEFSRQRGDSRQIGMVNVVEGALPAAKDDQ